jgi:nucleotide-binding universal stress UspA family protein
MTAQVLVPLDGTDKDERAVTAAVAAADLTGNGVRLIRVLDTPIASLSPRAATMGVLEAAKDQRASMQRSLDAGVERLRKSTTRAVSAEVAEGHDIAKVLVDRSSERDVDFVVMATRAAGGVSRAIRGSVADRVMRESPRPVLLVPPGADSMSAYKITLRKVLIPLDGSALALDAVDRLLALPKGRDLQYVLLEVVTTAFAGTKVEARSERLDRESATARASADARLAVAVERLRKAGASTVETRVVEKADPVSAIASVAKSEGVDFIAMSTRGLGGVARALLGSTAEGVVRDSVVPVLLFTGDPAHFEPV